MAIQRLRGSKRIIPAYAGSTGWPAHHIKPHPDHPRIRGEHVTPLPGETLACGSSPHTRGALAECLPVADFPVDHPRIRGEHHARLPAREPLRGSSPHTRGARLRQARPRRAARIIPAYAGSTSTGGMTASRHSDHPRIRGEHRLKRARGLVHEGSSPHTRGARKFPALTGGAFGIIPAYAGSTAG